MTIHRVTSFARALQNANLFCRGRALDLFTLLEREDDRTRGDGITNSLEVTRVSGSDTPARSLESRGPKHLRYVSNFL